MLSQLNGQLLNYSLLSKALNLSSPTVKRYLDFFENAFLITRLQPYFQNISKRLVKAPKVYFTDTGILHHFLSIQSFEQLNNSLYVGNSWEAFCVNQIRASLAPDIKLYFYRTQDGAECDLVFERAGKIIGSAEIKYSNAPNIQKGNYIAWNDLKSETNFILTPSSDDYPINKGIRVCSLKSFVLKYISEL